MDIQIEHHDGKYPSFNISLHSAPGSEPFLVIKGCKIVEGSKGPFISYPSRKQDDGRYWNHVYGGEKFNAAVMKKAQASKPQAKQAPKGGANGSGFESMDDDVPFISNAECFDMTTSKAKRMSKYDY